MNKRRIFAGVLLMLGLLLAPIAGIAHQPARAAGIIYVDCDATGADNGTSWADAYTDLQDALADAASGDEVWVAEGVYRPGSAGDRTATFQLKNGVGVYGGFAGTETARSQRDWQTNVTVLSGDIDDNDTTNTDGIVTDTDDIAGGNSYHVVTGSGTDSNAILDGFTITGGKATQDWLNNYGGGMINEDGSPTLVNLTFIGNYVNGKGGGISNRTGSAATLINVTFSNNTATQDGGGLYSSNSPITLTDVTFNGNAAADTFGDGGGMSNYGDDPVLTNVVFHGNTAGWEGGGMYTYSGSPSLTNVVFSGNSAEYSGGGLCNDHNSNAVLTNVTFSGNTAADTGGGMRNFDNSNPDLYNCILWGNSAGTSGDQIANYSSTPTIYYSLIQDSGGSGSWDTTLGADGGGNIDADPQFIDADGADDTPGTADDNLRLEGNSPAVDAGDNGWLTASTDLDYHVRRVDMPQADTGNGTAPIVDMGAYEAHVLYVDQKSPQGGANDGSSWYDAYRDLQTALYAATANTEIWVAEGIYRPDEWHYIPDKPVPPDPAVAFELINEVAVYGGFSGIENGSPGESSLDQRDWEANVTVLSGDLDLDDIDDANGVVTDTANIVGDNSYHVVDGSSTDSSAVLDGFTITAGHASESGINGRGAGIYINSGSPTLRNLILSGNLAGGNGGGMYSSGNSRLTGVTFSANTAEISGGGMYNYYSDPTLTDVLFSRNHADSMGGGLFNSRGDITLTNAAFIGNSVDSSGGGICNYEGSLTLTNGVFSGNTADSAGGLFNYKSDATVTNVTFSRNTATFHGGGMLNQESGTIIVTNCILWQNSTQIRNILSVTPTIFYSIVQYGCPADSTCDHLSTSDPKFVDADGDDDENGTLDDNLHLQFDSPAIDAGDNSAVPGDVTTDIAGDPRFFDMPNLPDTGNGSAPIVDMGAYEARLNTVYLPLVVRNH